ncbi:MAG: hypothetical protein ABH821_02965 [archaeon]
MMRKKTNNLPKSIANLLQKPTKKQINAYHKIQPEEKRNKTIIIASIRIALNFIEIKDKVKETALRDTVLTALTEKIIDEKIFLKKLTQIIGDKEKAKAFNNRLTQSLIKFSTGPVV